MTFRNNIHSINTLDILRRLILIDRFSIPLLEPFCSTSHYSYNLTIQGIVEVLWRLICITITFIPVKNWLPHQSTKIFKVHDFLAAIKSRKKEKKFFHTYQNRYIKILFYTLMGMLYLAA